MSTHEPTLDPDAPADPIDRELAEHQERDCPSCGGTFLRGDGKVPAGGYTLPHCPMCAFEVTQRESARRPGVIF